MTTITPESPENEQRIVLAAAHRTIGMIYSERSLPFLRWRVTQYGEAYAHTLDLSDLDTYAAWLDQPQRNDLTSETMDFHRVCGTKEGVALEIAYVVQLDPLPA